MTRSARLTAVMLAALFAAVLATPAHATGGSECSGHTRTGGSGCKAEGTKFHDLDADGKRDSGEPGLAGWRIWADYDDDGVRDSGEPYDDTDSAGRYMITGINPPKSAGARTGGTTTYSKYYYRLREQRPGGGTDGWACSYPNASTDGGFGSGKGGDFGCGWGPIDAAKYPHKTGKDFGNYKKPKITVIKKLVPASDAGRFDLKVDGATVKAAAGDGGTGTIYVKPGTYTVSEIGRVRHEPRRLHRLDRVHEEPRRARAAAAADRHRRLGRRGRLHDHQHPQGQGRDQEGHRPGRDRRHRVRLHAASRAPSASSTTTSRRSRACSRARIRTPSRSRPPRATA